MNDVKCLCEICGKEVVTANFANLPDDEVCVGIVCDDCAKKLQAEENSNDIEKEMMSG